MVNQIVEPVDVAAAVEYRADSVVSRVIFRTETGTMTAFAFAEGQGLSEHSNPNDAVISVLEGAVHVTIGGRNLTLDVGQMVHLPADVPHTLHGGAPFKMLLTIMKRGVGGG